MRNVGIAILFVVLGAALGDAWAKARGPLWTYHNGNTLQGQTAEYRRGFMIGVVDGYLQGQRARAETGDDGLWLEHCLTAGWTLKRTDRELADRFEVSVPLYPNPAAAIVIDNLKDACAAKAK
ncbi:MAG: hypothetical protein COW30_18285 [Rhodospirillales bacterium CG15_BIG_FIL_POST_REV_8_21_14_020_66_15]|nr:MAG: hypothetical protein COW30_18285 [Rhodospirillales bacterium CG15_BIG_FIL_POST_REV_8_21_14_020_66_15]